MKIISQNIVAILALLLLSNCISQKDLNEQQAENERTRIALEDNIVMLKKLLNKSTQSSETTSTINNAIDDISTKVEQAYKEIDKQTGKKTKTRLNNLRLKTEIISQAMQELKVVQIAVEKVVSEKLESDLSFDVGKSTLKESGKKEIDDMVQNIRMQIQFWNDFPKNEQPKKYADKVKKIAVNITGYADLQGSTNTEQRIKYNLELSNERANAVRSYFEFRLTEIAKTEKIEIKLKAVGKGEEPPVGLKNTTKIDNPERRICVITLGVIPTF
ncbi:MAG: OmpA family protein [Chitinophagales bacterium]|nr:OmpA family protein [Chitinophagales bacterium]